MLDVIVVGAGAAGIGAGLALLRNKAKFVILEAKDRVGGRAYSESHSLGHRWDQGCHWFHSASINPLRKIALKLGHDFVDSPAPYSTLLWRDGAFADVTGFEEAYEALIQRMGEADVSRNDAALATLMDSTSPWHTLLRHDMALTYSQETENISIADAKAFDDTGENIPVRGGYGHLIARLAQALPIKLSTPVTKIEQQRDSVRVVTHNGTLEARHIIVAVPQRVLEREQIKFSPALPSEIADVFANVRMGWFEKAGFAFDRPVFGKDGGEGVEIFARIWGEDWPVAFQLGPDDRPIAIGHVAGDRARDLTEKDRMAYCEDALAECYGASIRRHIIRRASSQWTADPFIGGAYSCARPGHAHLRKRLHSPVHERIHFAGEHASLDAMATAHGAFVTGHAAVSRALGASAAESDALWLPDLSERATSAG